MSFFCAAPKLRAFDDLCVTFPSNIFKYTVIFFMNPLLESCIIIDMLLFAENTISIGRNDEMRALAVFSQLWEIAKTCSWLRDDSSKGIKC